ncbi:MAG: hypothetical protein JOZ46_12630 [Candidatus Dormibacteraeota bacterium]|nr:hypothetical protein [Candidatus Dormibacteraeota bacterium]MBV9526647.1 hypothetical protein [Candidatus Dormibacteraeota bacterium]
MLPYVIAGIVAVVLLYGAYRMLGGSIASRPVDSNALLRSALDAALAATDETPDRALRRRLDGAGQLLQQVETHALSDAAAAAHALLSVAVDELSWSLRLRQSPGYAGATGMHAAVDALQQHAARCLEEARSSLMVSAPEVAGSTA